MRKVILQLAVSLDSRIEGPGGEYDWCFTDQDYGMKVFLESIDALFLGRKCFEMIGDKAYGMRKHYVFSSTLKKVKGETEIVSGDIAQQVGKIKSSPGKNIWLYGGASLTASLMNLGLVDELLLAVHPIVLGSGRLLFDGIPNRVPLEFIESKSYGTGLVMMHYRIKQP